MSKISVTHILLAGEQTTKKSKYIKHYKTKIRRKNPHEKFTGSLFVKLNPREMIKK